MGEQQSQKQGLRSSAQKEARAREGYDPIPPSTVVGGAFGRGEPASPSEQELIMSPEEMQAQEKQHRRAGKRNPE
jgi:hypothetical protein